MGLASVEGKLGEYLALRAYGLNTLELDVKDENGSIGFVVAEPCRSWLATSAPPVSTRRQRRPGGAEEAGVYLIGRVVVFADPTLAPAQTGSRCSGRTARRGAIRRAWRG